MYDSLGNPVANQAVRLLNGGDNSIVVQTTTNVSGDYSLQIGTGTYTLTISSPSSGNSLSLNVPQTLLIRKYNYSLTKNTVLDINLTLKKVDVHVQDSAGNPVNLTAIKATANEDFASQSLSIGGGITDAWGLAEYGTGGSAPKTNTSGNVTLWLFTTDNVKYTFTATPPSGSNFVVTTIPNITITGDTSQTITMQQPINLSGHVYDTFGNPIVNQTVRFLNPGDNSTVAQSTTSASGSYTLQASTGTYTLAISSPSSGNNLSLNVPQTLLIRKTDYAFSQNSTLDIAVPTKKIDIHVQDPAGNSISGVKIQANANDDYASHNVSIGGGITDAWGLAAYINSGNAPQTDASGNVTLWLFPTDATPYTLLATPPSGSTFQPTTISNFTITSDSQKIITLQQPVTLSGQMHDSLGNPVANQIVRLLNSGDNSTVVQTTTDGSGNYSLQVSTGTYTFSISSPSSGNSLSLNVPQTLLVRKYNYSLTQNTVLNINIPLKKVDVHVQDPAGNPVNLTAIKAAANDDFASQSLSIGGGITDAWGLAEYGTNGTAPKTNSSGDVVLWLFTTDNVKYTFTATPPSGSNFSTFVVNNISITGDQTELVSLQYNHATPSTTAILAPVVDNQVNYSDPTTVTLSATAAEGYTIANTYYTVDSGSQQTYSSPFTVSGSGSHTITYWSVDNSGVQETHNNKSFTIVEPTPTPTNTPTPTPTNTPTPTPIPVYSLTGAVYVDANQNGVQDEGEAGYGGASVTLDNNQTTTTDNNGNYSISNLQTGVYIETLTLPDGYLATTSNPVTLSLSADTTQNFGIAPVPTNTPTPTETPTPTPTEMPTPTPTPVPAYTLSGTVYKDINENGFQDGAEAGYTNATVQLSTGQTAATDTNGAYTFTDIIEGTYVVTLVTPDGYFTTTTNPVNIPLSADTTQNFGITTPHNKPTTTVILAPNPDSRGEYPNPVTVTLNAIPDTNYSIVHTYYTVDNGTGQTYSTPFTVSGSGSHTITYWSVDNASLEEIPHPSQSFTISANSIDVPVQAGQTTPVTIGNATLLFSDITSGGYITQTTFDHPQGGLPPTAYRFLGTYYELTTTATYTGSITISIRYDPADVLGQEENLKLFHWYEQKWQNITTSVDTVNHIITGVSDSLSPFAIGDQDITPPSITSLQLSSYVIPNGNSSTISVKAQDDMTGVNTANYSLTSSTGQVTTGSLSFISPANEWQAAISPSTGVYTVKVTVADKAGNESVSDNLYLAVYDPSAGFVTGGGWVIPDVSTRVGVSSGGKSNFGFEAKYINGAPSGNLTINYKQDSLEFKSTALEWLVVSGSASDFQGQASLNGSGSYTYRVHVVDSSPDQYDIRIWGSGGSFEQPAYRISNNLGGGNIIIHQ